MGLGFEQFRQAWLDAESGSAMKPLPNPAQFDPQRRRRLARRRYLLWQALTRGQSLGKRLLDLVVVVPALLALMPLFLLVGVLIRSTDGGPMLYWQRRVGLSGREFDFPKFRSMGVNSDEVRRKLEALNQHGAQGVTFKMKRDPRITWIGRIIRRFSIDELPQLWCVLKGDMTLVGPRPPLPSEVARYTLADRERLCVVPGLTCIWQVSGRSDVPFDRQVVMDVAYIHQRSLLTDLALLLRTVPAVVLGKGAY